MSDGFQYKPSLIKETNIKSNSGLLRFGYPFFFFCPTSPELIALRFVLTLTVVDAILIKVLSFLSFYILFCIDQTRQVLAVSGIFESLY